MREVKGERKRGKKARRFNDGFLNIELLASMMPLARHSPTEAMNGMDLPSLAREERRREEVGDERLVIVDDLIPGSVPFLETSAGFHYGDYHSHV